MQYRNKAEEAARKILKAFENPQTLPEPLSQVFIQRHDGSPCRKWSWSNQLIVALNGHSEARGFRQWEAVGRQVKKGEKAVRILSPLVKKVRDENADEEKTIVYGFKGTPVFGLTQTEGEPPFDESSEVSEWLRQLPLREIAETWGLSVEAYNGDWGGTLGAYRTGSSIALGVTNLSTWCHELVHAADDRNTSMKGKKLDKEVVAELGGAVLLMLLRHEYEADLGGCWKYINRYAKKERKEVLSVCSWLLDRTCEAVSLILDTAEEQAKEPHESSVTV